MSDVSLGKNTLVKILLGRDTRAKVNGEIPVPPDPSLYVELGGTRGLEQSNEWGTIDATSRSTKGNVRESIVDYLTVSGSFDGVWHVSDEMNLQSTKEYFQRPPSGTPYAWIMYIREGDSGSEITEEIYTILTAFNKSDPYDDVGSFDMTWSGQQGIITTVTPAP